MPDPTTLAPPRYGWLQLDGWAGRTQHKVEVVGETDKRYRIKAITLTKLAGRMRWLRPGDTVLIPKHAVRDRPHENVPIR